MKVENCKLGVEAHPSDKSICLCRTIFRKMGLVCHYLHLSKFHLDLPDNFLSDYTNTCNFHPRRKDLPACKFYDTHK